MEEPGGLYSPWGCKELDMTEYTYKVKTHTHTHILHIHFTFVPNTALIKKKKEEEVVKEINLKKFCLKMYGILLEIETEL